MAEPTLYERLGGIFAIAAVVDNFSDRLLRNPKIVDANPELHEWHTVTYHTRLPGLKWGRTLWLASLAGGLSNTPAGRCAMRISTLRSHPRCSTKSLRNSPTPWMSFRCPSARSKRSWPASPERRAKLPPVPSPGLSTGAAGVEPGVTRQRTPSRDDRTRRGGDGGHHGRCPTITRYGQADQWVATGRCVRRAEPYAGHCLRTVPGTARPGVVT